MAETIYSREQIDEWLTKLDKLAEKPRTRFTKRQVVEAMIEEIEQALAAHSYDEVADSLKSWGFDIPSGSLKQYVNAYRRSREPQKPGSIRNRSTAKKKKNVTEKPQVTTATADSEEATPGTLKEPRRW